MLKHLNPVRIASTILLFLFGGVLVWNADVLVRAYHAFQTGTFTLERLRFDIASFDIGRSSNVVPVAARVSPIDGMTQLFVPAGEFLMGNAGEIDVDSPQRKVFLDAFWIDKVEVTNSMYEKCIRAGVCSLPIVQGNPYYEKWIYRDYPVVYVNWFEAGKYCAWTGRRLPTEAEWEKAARGTAGQDFPWGNERPNPRLANFNESLIGGPLPVYRYPLGASPFGALNMAGNVREWVADWFNTRYYVNSSPINPTGPETGTERSMRSGAYDADANEIFTYSRYKHEPDSAGLSRGFRCAESGE
jgi:formylglycine-generating enzyme required for sulfatase activity